MGAVASLSVFYPTADGSGFSLRLACLTFLLPASCLLFLLRVLCLPDAWVADDIALARLGRRLLLLRLLIPLPALCLLDAWAWLASDLALLALLAGCGPFDMMLTEGRDSGQRTCAKNATAARGSGLGGKVTAATATTTTATAATAATYSNIQQNQQQQRR